MGTNQRTKLRQAFAASGMVFGIDGKLIVRCRLSDVSAGGAQIVLEKEAPLPQRFILAMSLDGKVRRFCTLAWQFSIVAGAKFDPRPEQQPPQGPAR